MRSVRIRQLAKSVIIRVIISMIRCVGIRMGKVQKCVLRVAGYMSTFVVGIWTQLKSLEATNGILLTKIREMPTSKKSKRLQETYYVP
jgi:hypothetical protein